MEVIIFLTQNCPKFIAVSVILTETQDLMLIVTTDNHYDLHQVSLDPDLYLPSYQVFG